MSEARTDLPERFYSWEELAWMVIIDTILAAVLGAGSFFFWPPEVLLVAAGLVTVGMPTFGWLRLRRRQRMRERVDVHRLQRPSPPGKIAA